jgi:hypothetical protein
MNCKGRLHYAWPAPELSRQEKAQEVRREAYPRKFPGIKTIPTTATEIKSTIHVLKAKNSSGYS